MLKLLICTLFLIQSIQSQTNNQVNIEGSVIKNSNFFEGNLIFLFYKIFNFLE
jgi:hypothetical protein